MKQVARSTPLGRRLLLASIVHEMLGENVHGKVYDLGHYAVDGCMATVYRVISRAGTVRDFWVRAGTWGHMPTTWKRRVQDD